MKNISLSSHPFIFSIGLTEIKEKDMQNIFEFSEHFQKPIDFNIANKSFEIKFEKKSDLEREINLYDKDNNNKFYYSFDGLIKPLTLKFINLNLEKDEIKIYSLAHLETIFNYYKKKYSFLIDDLIINELPSNFKKNDIIMTVKFFQIEKKILDIFLEFDKKKEKENFNLIENNNLKEINPLLLSPNFYEINSNEILTENFKLIINSQRKNLFEKIDNFMISKKLYYLIIGNDGIGKTISFLYYSLISEFDVIYLNLKACILYDLKKVFFNEIAKYYFINEKKNTKETQIKIQDFIKLNSGIISGAEQNNLIIYKFWSYLETFLMNIKFKTKTLIILDQYKNITIDKGFFYLNNIIKNVKDNNFKILISCSLNNYDIEKNFIRNIHHLNFNDNEENDDEDNINDPFDLKNICNFYENILIDKIDKEENEIKENYYFSLNNIPMNVIVQPQFILETPEFENFVIKEYFSELSKSSLLLKEFNKEEIECLNNFNYNLKYTTKYIKFKKDNENMAIEDIIKNFYEISKFKIINKIDDFYLNSSENNNIMNFQLFEYQKLLELRNLIYDERLFSLNEIKMILPYFPMKYLQTQININWNKKFDCYNVPKNRKFKIQYVNNFIKIVINHIINEIEKSFDNTNNIPKCLNDGNFFEKEILRTLLNQKKIIFGQSKFNRRNVFSLIGITNYSKKTIDKKRAQEDNILYEYYDIKQYNCVIDDIDEKNPDKLKLTEDVYILIQISMTGKSFDFAILTKSKDETWFLSIYQITKRKKKELKKKDVYIEDLKNCEEYLSKLYNIKIEKIYFTFILPFELYDKDFLKNLEKNKINYIYYKIKDKEFIDKEEMIVSKICLKDSEIKNENNMNNNDLSNLKLNESLNIWNKSVNKFISRKLKRGKLFKIYTKNLEKSFIKNEIKLILDTKVEKRIIQKLNEENLLINDNYKMLFLLNISFKNIESIYNKNKLITFFSINQKYYFFYEYYYEISDKIIKVEKPITQINNDFNLTKRYKKNMIQFKELHKYHNIGFSYILIGK